MPVRQVCQVTPSTYHSIELCIHLQYKIAVYEVFTSKGYKDQTQTEQPISYKDDFKSIILEHYIVLTCEKCAG